MNQSSNSSNPDDQRPRRCDPSFPEHIPLIPLFFRLLHALMSDKESIPELDALPMAQLRLLFAVNFDQEAPMKEFSERLGIAQSSITKLADRLAKRGLIERIPDPADRRIIRLTPSDLARKILSEDKKRKDQTFDAIWSRLSETEKPEVLLGIETLLRAAEAYRSERSGSESAVHSESTLSADSESSQPLLDLMNRPIRGKQQPVDKET